MKILFVNFSIGGFAGDAVQMLLVAKGLQKLGHEVTVATTDGDGYFFDKEKSKRYFPIRKKLLDAKGKIVEIDGVPVQPIHCLTPKIGMYCPDATKVGRKIIKNYDVVYAINWYYHLAMVFSKIAHECKVPFIVAGMASLQEKARGMKKRRKWIADMLYTKKMISHAAGFHSVGNLETSEYIKLGADPNKVYLIDHGIILDNFIIKNRTGIIERIGIDLKHKQYLLDVGRIDPKKGLEILLQAFARLIKTHSNLVLVIVGTGSDNYVQQIKQTARELNVIDHVRFTGFVTEDEKLELLESAKLFVVTSHSDVHTTAAIEALTMGVPVIITKASDFPEIDEYEAGITVDTDVDSVYNALVKLLSYSDLLAFSQNAKKLVSDKFLLENQIKKYEHMFIDVVKKYKQVDAITIKK
ncbi:MAG: glycosyltransferase [Nitrosopumilaceae archaeon]